ncbi:hypothetical protein ACN6LC_004516 [Streptomyces violaceoruber]|uniref:Membrane protein n=2 Tax=Streptomyces coelicolor TaxID=1902 RepID=Q9AD06_STRCO|nr:hypothetical protein [Streptomyces sp. NRRL_B-16638]AGO88606.1 hypothetical protein [Streptomyces coelicolor]MDX2930335.1 hypothetical protein [Streptomyces sp. NRRL_B-16638]CAC36665.1 putative membrane protein [Streptomyces coelicolor A3(2)]
MEPTTLAADWITIGTGFGSDLKTLIFTILIPVLCGIFIVVVGLKTRAPGPTLMAVIFAGIVLGLSLSIDTIGETTSDTVDQYNDGGGGDFVQGDQ